jgi:hypothetical protein
MVEYYNMLGESSDRMTVWDMGETTLGNPFLALIVTSPANHARLDEFQRMNATQVLLNTPHDRRLHSAVLLDLPRQTSGNRL